MLEMRHQRVNFEATQRTYDQTYRNHEILQPHSFYFWPIGFLHRQAPQLSVPILQRNKDDFSSPIAEWLNAELGEAVRAVLFSPHSLFDEEPVRQKLNQDQSGMADWRAEIWALDILPFWWDPTWKD